jgi:cob(I)alamin adenosyltransferase
MERKVKIYTKGGDKGQTSLLGGTRVPKYHGRVEAYGTLDEFNSFLGLLRDQLTDKKLKDDLLLIQEKIFIAESHLATENEEDLARLPDISSNDIAFLESEIDAMTEGLPELTSFVIPGGHPAVSFCHVARTVCRRAERTITRLSTTDSTDPVIISYMNRLSDYLFVLARKLSHDLQAEVVQWKTGKPDSLQA